MGNQYTSCMNNLLALSQIPKRKMIKVAHYEPKKKRDLTLPKPHMKFWTLQRSFPCRVLPSFSLLTHFPCFLQHSAHVFQLFISPCLLPRTHTCTESHTVQLFCIGLSDTAQTDSHSQYCCNERP